VHCDPHNLCDRCLSDELARLRPIAETRGVELARILSRSIVPDPAVRDCLDEQSQLIRHHVDELAADPRLRAELAKTCAATARAHLT
jgi:hypothetical protein